MHPVEELPSLACLVRLQMSYKMPICVKISKLVQLRCRFLHTILAEVSQAGRVSLSYRLRRLRLGNRHQTNIFSLAATPQTRGDDSVLNSGDVV